MKKHIYILLLLLLSVFTYSQQGNVGINTNNPQEKLHVKGGIRFEPTDLSAPALAGYTLVSDANGNATWKNVNLSKPSVLADFNSVAYSKTDSFVAYPFSVKRSTFRTTGTSITLPQGKWLVMISLGVYVENKKSTETNFYPLIDGRNIWIRAGFADDNTDQTTTTTSSDITVGAKFASTSIIGPNPNGLITGEFFINQSQATPKTYFLKYDYDYFAPDANYDFKITNFGVSPTIVPENFIMAYSISF